MRITRITRRVDSEWTQSNELSRVDASNDVLYLEDQRELLQGLPVLRQNRSMNTLRVILCSALPLQLSLRRFPANYQ